MSGAASGPLAPWLGPWSFPVDAPSKLALGLAFLFFLSAVFRNGPHHLGLFDEASLAPRHRLAFLTIASFVAAFLSLAYIAFYLRGGPRIVDATSYFLQGRALSHGAFAWPLELPSASFRGRFLLEHDGTLAGIFPPGFPLLLALGFLLRAPLVVGPLLAAALVVATYLLTREIARSAAIPSADAPVDPRVEAIARLAVLLSIASAALRYHTADTMAHGASALGIALALTAALRARRTGSLGLFALAGLAVGYVAATRPASAPPIAIVALVLAVRTPRTRRIAPLVLALATLPGLALLAAAQRAATGDLFASTQRAYYAVSDGPPGCFRYGFGAGVGCHVEHAEIVARELANGYDAMAALTVTARRLLKHLADVANLGPLALLALAPIARGLRRPDATRACAAVIAGVVLAYVPFYFDGSYPGGGARFLVDVLPIEHALLALAVHVVAPRAPIDFARRAGLLVAVALAAFALHASAWHRELAERDGGRPLFEPDVLQRARVDKGLLLVDSDHAWNLAFTAFNGHADAEHALVAARLRGDDHDRVLFERLKRPPAHRYTVTPEGPTLTPWSPPITASSLAGYSFESEADWPPLAQARGWVEPRWASTTCASGARMLTLLAAEAGVEAEAWLELPIVDAGPALVTPHVAIGGGAGSGTLELFAEPPPRRSEPLASWGWHDAHDQAVFSAPPAGGVGCRALTPTRFVAAAPRAFLRLAGSAPIGGTPVVSLDRVDVGTAPR